MSFTMGSLSQSAFLITYLNYISHHAPVTEVSLLINRLLMNWPLTILSRKRLLLSPKTIIFWRRRCRKQCQRFATRSSLSELSLTAYCVASQASISHPFDLASSGSGPKRDQPGIPTMAFLSFRKALAKLPLRHYRRI